MLPEEEKQAYPWYEIVESTDELRQGDCIDNCEIVVPTYIPNNSDNGFQYEIKSDSYKMSIIVMSQSCDLGNDKGLENVLVCLRRPLSEYNKPGWGLKRFYDALEKIRKGQNHRCYMLNECSLVDLSCETQIVDLGSVFSIPYDILKQMAKSQGKRLRLCPPYREKLAQAFGYYYMRIGLPVDIKGFDKSLSQVAIPQK